MKDLISRGCARGLMADRKARESPMSQVLVAKATVVKVIVPKSMAVANDDTGASAITESFDSPILWR